MEGGQSIAARARLIVALVALIVALAAGRVAASEPTTATLVIQYTSPDESGLSLVWALDGWTAPPREYLPAGSTELAPAVESPLVTHEDGTHSVELVLPVGSTIDFVVHVRQPVERWDNNGGDGVDFHYKVLGSARFELERREEAPRPPSSGVGGHQPGRASRWLLIVTGVALCGWFAWRRPASTKARIAACVVVALLALSARVIEVRRATVEVDEEDYVPIAMHFDWAAGEGDLKSIIDFPYVTEHPRFVQVLYAGSIRATGSGEDFERAVLASRWVSIIAAVVCAGLLAWWSPIAGIVWSLFTISTHYTSIAYLDSVMTLCMVVCILAFDAAWQSARDGIGRRTLALMAISAVGAGLAVSSKYLAAPAPLAIAGFFVYWLAKPGVTSRGRIAALFAAYVALALVVMVLADPYLWTTDIVGRIVGRLRFHQDFSHSELVDTMHFPWWQPFTWLVRYGEWGATGSVWFDRVFTGLAAIGCLWLWRERPRVFTVGIAILGFLLLWNTKWPQYETALIPWLGFAVDAALCRVGRVFARGEAGPPVEASA